ncbi:hypothetical protein [Calidithermus chliarophilus]|uniref:hypothetical protein n=1 Tax=Calidithermus chliarophilus TaxID=52023 RepID=UPI000413BBC9|nr:hypothetical protein [Calidithermus chliarophilus]
MSQSESRPTLEALAAHLEGFLLRRYGGRLATPDVLTQVRDSARAELDRLLGSQGRGCGVEVTARGDGTLEVRVWPEG